MSSYSASRLAKTGQETSSNQNKFLWVGVGVAAIIFIVVAVSVWQQTSFPFSFVGGPQQTVVLLRNPYDGEYEIAYTGKEPANLVRFVVQIESPQRVLHVDINQVMIIHNGQEVILEKNGTPPASSPIVLQPGDTFMARVTYYGQSIGAHYVYGFKIGYETGGTSLENALEIRDRKLLVVVE